MDSDKKTHGFCKAELRKRFRLVFYLGKLSLAAYPEQFGKPGRNPTGPAHASRLVFTDHNRPPTAAMRQRHNEEGRCAADRCSQPRGSRRPWQKAAHPARHPSLAGCSKRIASLTPPREYRFRNQSGTGHPRAGSSTLQTIRSSDHFSKGDIILMASRMSYRSFIWSTRLLDSVDQYMRQPFSSTAFSTNSSLKTHLHKRGCR